MVWTDLLSMLTKGDADVPPLIPINIQAEIAKAARVSKGTVSKYDIVEAKA